jgi:hypothetical protein
MGGRAAKAKGAGAERDVVKYLKEWFPYVDRRLAGATLDKGDISGIPGVTIEIKNHAKMDLAGWTEELLVEMANDKAWTGVVAQAKGQGVTLGIGMQLCLYQYGLIYLKKVDGQMNI